MHPTAARCASTSTSAVASAFASPPPSTVDCRASPPPPPPSHRAGSPLRWQNGRGSLAWLPGVAPWPGSLAWLPGLSSHWISPRWLCALVLGGTVGLAPYLRIGIRSFSKHTGTGMGGVGAGSAGARAEVAWRLRERQRSVERRAGSKYKGGAPARSRGGPSPLWARGALDDRTATTCQADRLHSKRCGVLGSEWGVGGRGLWGRAWSYGREGCDPG